MLKISFAMYKLQFIYKLPIAYKSPFVYKLPFNVYILIPNSFYFNLDR